MRRGEPHAAVSVAYTSSSGEVRHGLAQRDLLQQRGRSRRAAGRSPARTRRCAATAVEQAARVLLPPGARRRRPPAGGPPCRASRARRPRSRARRRTRASGRAATAHRACCRRPRAQAARSAAGSKATPSACRMCCSRPAISGDGSRFRLNCRQRDSTVTGSFCGSVVASRNLTCGGGSSSVFSSALKECARQHVHFVDQVDLVAAARRRVLHVVEQLARVVDLGARGRVDLDQVDEAALVDLAAGAALAAGLRADARLAVQRLGEDARDRRLADAARAGEQERVVDAAASRAHSTSAWRTCSWPTSSSKVRGRHLRARTR